MVVEPYFILGSYFKNESFCHIFIWLYVWNQIYIIYSLIVNVIISQSQSYLANSCFRFCQKKNNKSYCFFDMRISGQFNFLGIFETRLQIRVIKIKTLITLKSLLSSFLWSKLDIVEQAMYELSWKTLFDCDFNNCDFPTHMLFLKYDLYDGKSTLQARVTRT